MASSKVWKSVWGTIDWKHDPEEVVLQKVEQLLAAGAGKYINARNMYGETVLIRSASMGYESVVESLLLVSGVDVNAKNIYGHTTLMNACGKGYVGIVEQLLKVPNIDINAQDSVGTTALMTAVTHGNREVVKRLLAFQKINIRIVDNYGNTALSMARWNPKEPKIIGMIKRAEIKLKQREFLRDELKAIREKFSSDKMREDIPNTAQRLAVRCLLVQEVRKVVDQIKYLTKA